MKLSKREKNLLLISLVLLIALAVYLYVITPIHNQHAKAVEEHELTTAQYKAIKFKVKDDDDMSIIVNQYREKISSLEMALPPVLHLEEIIDIMFNHFENYDVVINNITFNINDSTDMVADDDEMGIEKLEAPMSVEEILDTYDANRDQPLKIADHSYDTEITYENISYMAIGLNFEANYNVLKDVMKGLDDLTLTTIISEVNMSKIIDEEESQDNNRVAVSMNLSIPFYYDNEKEKDYIYNYSFDKGVDYIEHGPFEYDVIENDSVESSDIASTVQTVETTPEFFITLNSVASDLPAQAISYYEKSDSEISLNANTNERFDLTLTEVDDRLFFNYANDVTAYPSSVGDMLLTPQQDQIVVNVLSTKRIGSDDLASMTLFLENQTSREVIFNIYYDDTSRPRFNVISQGRYEIKKY